MQARVELNSKETYIKPPKTERGRRTLPLSEETIRAFQDYRIRLIEESLRYGEGYAREHDLVVVDESGAPIRPEFYSDEFRRISADAGIPIIRLHDARHTAASYLHAQALPIAAISAWLGHASAAFTMRTYVHAHATGLNDARDLLAGALSAHLNT